MECRRPYLFTFYFYFLLFNDDRTTHLAETHRTPAPQVMRDALLPPPGRSYANTNASAANPRIACILVADFPLAAAMRQSPELCDRPLVLIDSAGRRNPTGVANMECRFVSAHARARGVRAGMTVARARATAAGLAVMSRSTAAEASAAEALVDVALSFSPLVEAGADGEVYLNLGGLKRLHQRLRVNSRREGMASAGASASSSPAEMPDAETALAQEALGRVARLGDGGGGRSRVEQGGRTVGGAMRWGAGDSSGPRERIPQLAPARSAQA